MCLLVFVQSFPPQPVLSDSFPSFLCQSSPNQLLHNIYLREKKKNGRRRGEGRTGKSAAAAEQAGRDSHPDCL